MEQSDTSIPNMETDFKGIEDRDEVAYKAALDSYFQKPELVQFLMSENLALKLILFEKGLMSPEDHKEAVKTARKILEEEVRSQINEWRNKNPKESALFDVIYGSKQIL